MRMMRSCAFSALLLTTVFAALPASESDWFVPLGLPPPAAPKRISGGEGVPPLPLPATPLRRSERKRQPSAPPLFGKVVWGEAASFTEASGDQVQISDWNLCPADVQQILEKTKRTLGVAYGSEQVDLATFHYEPEKLPALFISGVRTVAFSDEQVARLRDYVLRGGLVIFDSVAGSPYFTAAARAFCAKGFPERPLRLVPGDHPLFRMMADVDKAVFPRNAPGDRPTLEAVYVGSRCGVIVSPYGLGTGWDDHGVERIPQAVFYDVDTANRLGINLVAYAIGYANVGREEAKPELFGALDERRPANEFVFAQLRHEGHWDVHPGAAAALLGRLRTDTSLGVNRKRLALTAGEDDLSPYPVLYLTGADDFRFSPAAVEHLRAFLHGSGTLVIDNGLGLAVFDAAVRRELAAVLPGAQLAPLPADHPLYAAAIPVREVQYSPAALREHAGLTAPLLEGITLGGDLRVIYSPIALAAGWDAVERPMVKAYQPTSATALGLNLVVYAVTH
ncbi:MAG: DUF4159 domain-containing protein [Planctomycetes bacterium]|nr:DUF4159 domain-containing protein [Planctomycetota bacterium]